MQYPPTPPDAPEPPASLQFQQLYPPMPLPPPRRKVQWGRIALIAIPVVVCVALVTAIVINVLRIVVVPEVHATLAAGTTATLKTANGEIVAITISSINPSNPTPIFVPHPLPPGYSPYGIMTFIQDDRTSDSGSSAWTAIGTDGKTYRGPIISFNSIVLVPQSKTPVPVTNSTMPLVQPIFVDFQLPSGVAVRSVICSLPSPQLGGFVQATAGRLYFDAP